jgi:hypothetical protein
MRTSESCLFCVMLVAVACGGDGKPGMPPGVPDAGPPARPLVLTDISAESPDLAAAPYGGSPGWDASDKYAPGVALADLDGDGILDLVQPRNDRDQPALRGLRIHRGLGDGRFVDATGVAWDEGRNATVAMAFDHDGDDDLDVFVGVDGGPSVLLRNDGAFDFVDVAAEVGLAAPGDRVFTAAAGDVDRDGDADVYLGNWNASAPDHGDGTAPNRLLRNDGGVFTDVTATAGVDCHGWSTLGLAMADLDGDGALDIFVANDFFDACLYWGRGDGTFVEGARAAGVARGTEHAMGVAVGDLDGDLDLDLYVTDDEVVDDAWGNALYLNDGPGTRTFASRASALKLDGLSTLAVNWLVCWGVGLVDLDHDGDLDVHVATHGERSELVWRNDGGTFAAERGLMSELGDADARGSAYGDIDGDGDIDVVVGRRGAGLQVLRNDTLDAGDPGDASDAGGRWLVVVPRPAAAAPGARVTISAGGRTQVAVVQAGASYLSSGPPVAHFGLGAAARVDQVEVTFPGGATRVLRDVAAGQTVIVHRDAE